MTIANNNRAMDTMNNKTINIENLFYYFFFVCFFVTMVRKHSFCMYAAQNKEENATLLEKHIELQF